MTPTLAKFRILNIFLDPNTTDRYSLFVVDIVKNINTNELLKAIISKRNHKKNLSLIEVHALAKVLLVGKAPYTHLISNIQGFMEEASYVSLILKKEEINTLVTQYVTNFSQLSMGIGEPQNIQSGTGIYLHQTESGLSSYAIDVAQTEMSTFAFIFSIDLATKNKTHLMLQALKGDTE